MKKLLKVSLMAMLVAAPFAANATLPAAYSDGSTSTKPTVAAVADVASTSYVKGAYDTAIGYINELNTAKLDASVASSTYATKTELNGKQDSLSEAQLAAANSGITADKVSTYDGYAATIAGKQDSLSEAQLAAANSGITAAKVATYDGYATDIAGKADSATTLAGYGITDAYTKTETDSAITNNAAGATYSNTTSGLTATTLQGAIDEVAATAATAKRVTVHTTWGSDATTAPADVLVNAQ